MPHKHYKKPANQVGIAKKRIRFLFNEAKDAFKKSPKQADKCVKTARKIAMKYKIKLPSELKKRFCKNCHAYLVPSVNSRVRIHKHRIICYCFNCKHYMRHSVK